METRLNQTLNKTATCLNKTLDKTETCMNQTLNIIPMYFYFYQILTAFNKLKIMSGVIM